MELKTSIQQEGAGNKKISKVVFKEDPKEAGFIKDDISTAFRALYKILNDRELKTYENAISAIGALKTMLANSDLYIGERIILEISPSFYSSAMARIEKFNSAVSDMQKIEKVQNTGIAKTLQNAKKYFENAEFLE